jgi:hypothetical protein
VAAIVSGVVGAIIATALVVLAGPARTAQADRHGWKVLRPGWLLKGCVLLSAGLALLIGGAALFAGSAREDAAAQMIGAFLLAAAFGAASAYAASLTYGRTIRWKGSEISIRRRFGPEVVRSMSSVSSVAGSEARGEYRLTFRDGSTIRLSAYLHGTAELLDALRIQPGH